MSIPIDILLQMCIFTKTCHRPKKTPPALQAANQRAQGFGMPVDGKGKRNIYNIYIYIFFLNQYGERYQGLYTSTNIIPCIETKNIYIPCQINIDM